MSAHASYAPSSLARLFECPASFQHCQGIKNPDSPYASEGRLAHEIAEKRLKGEEAPKPTSEEMDSYVQGYVDYVEELSMLADFSEFEMRVKVDEEIWGTADTITILDGCLHVIDFKYGAGVKVEASENMQLAAYALGAYRTIPKNEHEIKRIMIHVYQPRVEDGISTWLVSDVREFVTYWSSRFEKLKTTCKLKNPEFRTGEHCRFCPGKATCPQMQEEAKQAAIEEFSEDAIANTDTEQLLYFSERAKTVKIFLAAVEEELIARAEFGEEIPGYQLIQTLKARSWALPEEEIVKKLKNQKLKLGDIYKQKLKSPTQLQKQLSKKFMEQYVTREPGPMKLKKQKDATEEFGKVEE